jgi:hypothetical protein
MKHLLLLMLTACGSPARTETLVVAPTVSPPPPATHSIVVVAPPEASTTVLPADTTPTVVPPAPVQDDAPFDRGAAAQGLARAGMTLVTCRQPGGPTGAGHVRVAFAPSGQVTRADVDPPFAGTPVGKCIEKTFEAIRVPAFVGASVTVGKTFTLPP